MARSPLLREKRPSPYPPTSASLPLYRASRVRIEVCETATGPEPLRCGHDPPPISRRRLPGRPRAARQANFIRLRQPSTAPRTEHVQSRNQHCRHLNPCLHWRSHPEELVIAGLPKRSDGTSTAAAANATSDRAATGLARLCRAPNLETEFMQTESLNAPAKTRQMFGIYPSRTHWTSRGCVLALVFALASGTRSS